jgi:hypothetical protein
MEVPESMKAKQKALKRKQQDVDFWICPVSECGQALQLGRRGQRWHMVKHHSDIRFVCAKNCKRGCTLRVPDSMLQCGRWWDLFDNALISATLPSAALDDRKLRASGSVPSAHELFHV